MLHGIPMKNSNLCVIPLTQEKVEKEVQKSALKDAPAPQNPFAEPPETHRNLYIRQIDKDLPTE